jgi:hypothetical protein
MYRAMAQNEFLSPAFATQFAPPAPNATSIAPPQPMGELYLQMFDIETDPQWMWWGVLHAFGSIAVAVALSFLAFAKVRFDRNIGSARRVIEPDDELVARAGGGQRKGGAAASDIATTGACADDGGQTAIELTGVAQMNAIAVAVAKEATALPSPPSPSVVGALSAPAVALDEVAKVDARSVLPFEPMSVVFTDIKYTVTLPDGAQRCLLQGVSGVRDCRVYGLFACGKSISNGTMPLLPFFVSH